MVRFHIRCINMKSEDLKGLGEYKCQACITAPPVQNEFEPSSKLTKKTEIVEKKQKRTRQEPVVPVKEVKRDAVRAKVVENLSTALCHEVDDSVKTIAESIETALYDALKEGPGGQCGHGYRSKYMSLLFNLRDPKNARLRTRILSGDLPPTQLIRLSPAELANEELSQVIKTVQEQSVALAVMEVEAGEEGFVRKTHKGEELVVASDSLRSSMEDMMEPSMTMPYMEDKIEENQESYQEESAEEMSVDWNGLILLQDVAIIETAGVSVGSNPLSPLTKSRLPANLHVSGRLAPSKAIDYLQSTLSTPTRSIHVLRVDPIPEFIEDGGKRDPHGLISYLVDHDRWAVVEVPVRDGYLRDIYLAPCKGLDANRLVQLGIIPDGSVAQGDLGFLAIFVISSQQR